MHSYRKFSNLKTKVALVGCGEIADAHLKELKKMASIELVAVCDLFEYLLRETAQRFAIPKYYLDYTEMLVSSQPDVVHICTPPRTHFELAKTALDHGSHVYVEKPVTLTLAETDVLLEMADKMGLAVCAGHNRIFDTTYLRAKKLIDDGTIGELVHMETHYGYSLNTPIGQQIKSNPEHWITQLPGQLFQNNISHSLSMIGQFIGSAPEVHALATDLRNNGAIKDELRVSILGERCTAQLVFTSNATPMMHIIRFYGTQKYLEYDMLQKTLIVKAPQGLPGVFGNLKSTFNSARQYIAHGFRNFGRFAVGREQFFTGMQILFDSFYTALRKGEPLPVSHDDLRLVSYMMEEINQQVYPEAIAKEVSI